MKVMSSDENHTSGNGGANWLGFSLSPQIKIDLTPKYPTTTSTSSSPNASSSPHQQSAAFGMPFLFPQHPTLCFDVCGGGGAQNNAGFLSPPPPLTVMPLKSDGSLCIMAEALSRSQPSQDVEPRLQKVLGGEVMGLSLDSLYYNQTTAAEEAANKQHHHQQYESFLSALVCQEYYQTAGSECQVAAEAESVVVGDNGALGSFSVGGGGGGGFGELQSLSLSMSPGSQSSCLTASQISISPPTQYETKKRGFGKMCQSNTKQTVHRKSIDTFGQRTSQFRGVTKHRWTGRYEAHLWDNSCKKEGQSRKGRQVYLGGYDMEEKAARAYDLAALKYWGLSTHTNFPIQSYKDEIEEMKHMTRQEYVAHLRRKSSGFSRGASMYRGVTRHHQHGRWQARIGRVAGNKDLYLGTFGTQEEAAEAYDVAAIKFRGVNAVTNFDISRYDVEKIMASNTLLAGEQAKRNKVELTETVGQIPSSENASGWRLVSHQPSACIEPLGHKLVTVASFDSPLFSLGLQELAGLETASPTQAIGEDSTKLGSANFSNSSSLVTSLNSSREGSPDRTGSSLQPASTLAGPASAWIAPVPVAPLPVFAAWGDA